MVVFHVSSPAFEVLNIFNFTILKMGYQWDLSLQILWIVAGRFAVVSQVFYFTFLQIPQNIPILTENDG